MRCSSAMPVIYEGLYFGISVFRYFCIYGFVSVARYYESLGSYSPNKRIKYEIKYEIKYDQV